MPVPDHGSASSNLILHTDSGHSTSKHSRLGHFLRGFTSSYWNSFYNQAHSATTTCHLTSTWNQKLVQATLTLSQNIWQDRNKLLHGSTTAESKQKLQQRILAQVHETYRRPPKLHCRYALITKIPLQAHLNMSTPQLQRWLARLSHQVASSKTLMTHDAKRQLTLKQAYKGACPDLFIDNPP